MNGRFATAFLPRDLCDIRSGSRTGQQTCERLARYSLRAAAENTISEFIDSPGHGPGASPTIPAG
ncbi:hypothetical protein [Streptomyces sp. 8P21H-1]|uniref:hypothetical protein n=1 Tax=Streptomyces sp. 8P21H-1 TaxID=2737048 RepID=UPI00156DC546|nr:hypothetical protein [Streptomyces sp. 8P21H-1]NSL42940.1 hypothetical protein [Streptomyces sp. 8P21H-1]